MNNGESLLRKLLERGDEFAIERGRLVVYPISGKPVPDSWMKKKGKGLIAAILAALNIEVYEYVGFSTGSYGKHRAGGVTLQFISPVTGSEAYGIFNVSVTRLVTTKAGKKGDALPKNSFRVGKRSLFYKFWLSTGLPMPRRLSEFGGYMGNLLPIIFTAVIENKRIGVSSLMPLSVPQHTVRAAILMGAPRAIDGQFIGRPWANFMGKDFHQARASSGLQPIPTAGEQNRGHTVISKCENMGTVIPFPRNKSFEDQTIDDWEEEYRAALGLPPDGIG